MQPRKELDGSDATALGPFSFLQAKDPTPVHSVESVKKVYFIQDSQQSINRLGRIERTVRKCTLQGCAEYPQWPVANSWSGSVMCAASAGAQSNLQFVAHHTATDRYPGQFRPIIRCSSREPADRRYRRGDRGCVPQRHIRRLRAAESVTAVAPAVLGPVIVTQVSPAVRPELGLTLATLRKSGDAQSFVVSGANKRPRLPLHHSVLVCNSACFRQ